MFTGRQVSITTELNHAVWEALLCDGSTFLRDPPPAFPPAVGAFNRTTTRGRGCSAAGRPPAGSRPVGTPAGGTEPQRCRRCPKASGPPASSSYGRIELVFLLAEPRPPATGIAPCSTCGRRHRSIM